MPHLHRLEMEQLRVALWVMHGNPGRVLAPSFIATNNSYSLFSESLADRRQRNLELRMFQCREDFTKESRGLQLVSIFKFLIPPKKGTGDNT